MRKVYKKVQPCKESSFKKYAEGSDEQNSASSSINTSLGWMYGTELTGLPLEPPMVASFLPD